MAIVFESIDSVKIDGSNAGNLLDVLTNHAPLRAEVLAACRDFVSGLQSDLATANARIETLLSEIPYNPRIIDAEAFYQRITKDEFAALSVSDDPMLKNIAKTILAYRANDWPVVFGSIEFQQMIGYMQTCNPVFLSSSRAAELTKDATRAEAYSA